MDDDSTMSIIDELERYFGSGEDLPGEDIVDTDELIHRQEDEDVPPAMPPESLEDFEKAILGETVPHVSRIPPANPD